GQGLAERLGRGARIAPPPGAGEGLTLDPVEDQERLAQPDRRRGDAGAPRDLERARLPSGRPTVSAHARGQPGRVGAVLLAPAEAEAPEARPDPLEPVDQRVAGAQELAREGIAQV